WTVSENTVAGLMREMGLAARRKKKRRGTTRPGRGRRRAPDLVGRKFAAPGINRRWYGDGTEITTGEGKLYLDSVLDMGSRRIVGFALGEHHDAELAYGAMAMAVAVRGGAVPGVVFHSDQGSEYTAGRFRRACERMGICQSMGRPGAALDNAVLQARHSTPAFGLRSLRTFATTTRAGGAVAAWIEDYNHTRRHSALGRLSPVDYELALAGKDAAGPPRARGAGRPKEGAAPPLSPRRPPRGRGPPPPLTAASHPPAGGRPPRRPRARGA